MEGVVVVVSGSGDDRRYDDIFLLLPHRIEINQRKEFVTSDQNRKSYPIRHSIDKKNRNVYCRITWNCTLTTHRTTKQQTVSSTAGMRLYWKWDVCDEYI